MTASSSQTLKVAHDMTECITRDINKLILKGETFNILPYSFSSYEQFAEKADPQLLKIIKFDPFSKPPGIVYRPESLEHSRAIFFIVDTINKHPDLLTYFPIFISVNNGQVGVPLPWKRTYYVPDARSEVEGFPRIIFEVNSFTKTPKRAREDLQATLLTFKGDISVGVLFL